MTSPSEHAATVRDFPVELYSAADRLTSWTVRGDGLAVDRLLRDAASAYVALAARADELAIAHDSRVADLDECQRALKAAETRADELEREREGYKRDFLSASERVEMVERERDDALQRLADYKAGRL